MRGKLRSIQVLRAIAVLAVLLYHAAGWSHGQAGVDLFFVISGVIIGIVMVGRSANAFIAARLWRIYPVYWFNALPLLAAAAVFGILTPARLAASLTLWPVWGSYAPAYLVPAWTLSFEMLFYGLVAVGLAWRRPLLVVPVLGAFVGLNAVVANPYLQFLGNPLVLEFCAGLLLLRLPRRAVLGAAATVVGIGLFAMSPAPTIESAQIMDAAVAFPRVASWGIPAALVVYGALCFEGMAGKWAAPLVLIGDASYSIYLSHYFLNLALPVWWPLRVLILVGAGLLMFVTVERPIMRWRRSHKAHPARRAIEPRQHLSTGEADIVGVEPAI